MKAPLLPSSAPLLCVVFGLGFRGAGEHEWWGGVWSFGLRFRASVSGELLDFV